MLAAMEELLEQEQEPEWALELAEEIVLVPRHWLRHYLLALPSSYKFR